jgi:tRNA U34 5-carboxymethylaminomethyl modifying GTPase MnmE/TrmE
LIRLGDDGFGSSNVSNASGLITLTTNVRHAAILADCIKELSHCYPLLSSSSDESEGDPVLAVEHLRSVTRLLGQITGFIETESVLDEIFSKFCIGK